MTPVHSPHTELVGALYRDHRGWLLAWLQRSTACRQRAEDLSQDTFVRLLGRERLDVPREPRAFLVAVAKGLLFDHFRRAALEQAYLTELALLPETEHPSPQVQHLILEDLKAIDRLLGKLSSKARAAFLHNRLDGLGHAEIAERLGVSVSRVRQYIAQGMRQCYIALYGQPT
ncbi:MULTISPECIES: RNA polymerase sigma factor [unclassified Pseudomonas]|uniref:RNA polymerase sigma factor n=1 Tax=unclassified Pseudomonas TaxID=196821 RepID=UPI00244A1489|nr:MULTISPECIES: RNA polymerase sigma factor [unclassified Pseudomonas]MDH0301369.1 RNA polymerase sigma factor [Pseudomonas sp. GD04091]MDH1983546.1 RNA polymerase sigma factor [Pseudomonas sp. GD03689]